MARKKLPPVSDHDRHVIGGLLRDLRRFSGYRSVETASNTATCPASRQSIYTYERGEQLPSLRQFLELVEFYVLEAPAKAARPAVDLRAHGVAAVVRGLELPAYHLTHARDLIARMQSEE
jgi:hypothetical protein